MRRLASALTLLLATRAAAAEGVAEAARRNVREVLRRPEFQPLADADRLPRIPHPDLSWLERVAAWLAEAADVLLGGIFRALGNVLGKLFRGLGSLFRGLSGGGAAEGASTLGTLVVWALVLAGVALLVWLLLRLVRASRAERAAGARALSVSEAGSGEDDALARTPEDWRRRAERMAARGERVEALRALYLELLAGLHRAGAIDYDRTRTNTAYVRDLARGHPARAPFVALTDRFDRAVYGQREPSERDLHGAMDEVDAVRGAFVRETAHA